MHNVKEDFEVIPNDEARIRKDVAEDDVAHHGNGAERAPKGDKGEEDLDGREDRVTSFEFENEVVEEGPRRDERCAARIDASFLQIVGLHVAAS